MTVRMKVTVKMFSDFKRFLPTDSDGDSIALEVESGTNIANILNAYSISPDLPKVITVNDEFQKQDYIVKDDDSIKIFPVAQGG